MEIKRLCQHLNILSQCRKYNVPLMQCPSFLFPLIGLVIMIAMVATYFVATLYTQPEYVAIIVLTVTCVLFVTGYLIVQGFERLAQANRMKSEFVGIVSHQLRTPLTGIKWTINLIRSKESHLFSEEQLTYLKEIEDNNQRMIRLVNDLLDVTRVEQGRLSLKPENVHLGEIAQELIAEYQELSDASKIDVSLEGETDLPAVFIDPQGVGLVLRNFVDNAIKYNRPGGWVKIVISKKKESIRCEVRDNGVGIPQNDQRNLFKKFFRSQNSLKNQTVGTGLGLFIAQAFIKESKGDIGFYSQEDKGSTFWFEIPLKQKI